MSQDAMRYFVSWTHSDPVYQEYVPDVRVLVSPPNVSLIWQARHWPSPPAELIVDSGAFQSRPAKPEEVLRRQRHIAEGLEISVGLCHLDVLMAGVRSPSEAGRRSSQNLSQAQRLIELVGCAGLAANVEPIGVIQGESAERVFYVAQALADMGYTRFALGSLARKVATSRDEVLRRVEAALEAVGSRLHILGVSSVPVLAALARLGVESADSGTPIKEASRGGLLYSRPFQRYKLASDHFVEWRRTYNFAELLSKPIPCDCPICVSDPYAIMEPHGKQAVNRRAVHNYYHLRRSIESDEDAL